MADALLGGIIINEILVDPNGTTNNFDTDGNGTAGNTDEYIELFNSSDDPIDISGLELWDPGSGNWFTFPAGSILEPNAHALVISGVQTGGALPTGGPNDLFFDVGRGGAVINNGGDNVIVYDPTNDEFIQAAFNGADIVDPTIDENGDGVADGNLSGFSLTATQVGDGEGFGSDTDGQSLQRTPDGADDFTTDAPTPGTTNVCFANGTSILTPQGARLVENLEIGDQVITMDHGTQVITWVFGKHWSMNEIQASPNLRPIKILKGCFGNGLPTRDLRLSRQHRVMIKGPIAQRMFNTSEVLVAAKDLLDLPGVTVEEPSSGVTYFHVMLSRHEVVIADGVPCESLYLGAEAIKSIPTKQLDDLLSALGLTRRDLMHNDEIQPAARTLITGPRARKLVGRHLKNQKPLIESPSAPRLC